MRKSYTIALALLAICMSFAPIKASACAIPVFRYALERWPPYPYHIFVFHETALEEKEEKALAALEESNANIIGRSVDINSSLSEELNAIWQAEKDKATLPWLVVRYPGAFVHVLENQTFWSSPFDLQKLSEVTNSQIRTECIRNMLSGMSAVWIYIEGNDKAKDEAYLKIVKDRLALIKKEVVLSPAAFNEVGDGEMLESVPLKIDFAIIRISRDDPKEQFFLNMLMKTEPALDRQSEKPMLFPVFGQGRALWALIGEGINEEMIDRTCSFMIGNCSCEIKDMNPGVDLLINADWYNSITNILSVSDIPLKLTGIPPVLEENFQTSKIVLENITEEMSPNKQNDSSLYATIIGAFIIIVITVGISTIIITQHSKR